MGDHLTDEEVSKIFFNEHLVKPNGDATIIHNVDFEKAIVKLQGGCEKNLNAREKLKLDGSKLPKKMMKK
jgi:hypothetical protein